MHLEIRKPSKVKIVALNHFIALQLNLKYIDLTRCQLVSKSTGLYQAGAWLIYPVNTVIGLAIKRSKRW